MTIFRRLRRAGRRAWAGVDMPPRGGSWSAIVAALIAVTTLAALELTTRPADLAGLPGFVANALGDPRRPDEGEAGWRTFENGVARKTAWGHETITLRGGRPEKYNVVSERQGVRVWRWRLTAREARKKPMPPVRVLDAFGRTLAGESLSWSVERRGDAWLVHLRVVDANLPLPYVLAPMPVGQRPIE